jgi:membrane-bound lytic murein transglycosylase B
MWFPRTDSANAHSQGEIDCNVFGTRLHLGLRGCVDIGCILACKFVRGASMSRREVRSCTATRRILGLIVCVSSCISACVIAFLISSQVVAFAAAANSPAQMTRQEVQRLNALHKRLCASARLSCSYVDSIFTDARLTIYQPPAPTPPPGAEPPRSRVRQPNPYLAARFGLLSPESLERCRSFIAAHALAFDAAQKLYGVPREVICGHLRIETDFGIVTPLTPYPLGTFPAIDRLLSLYVRRPAALRSSARFVQRQHFAETQLVDLLTAAKENSWDLFEIPGSSTGAIGLVQFEPSVFDIAVDGNGDGKIDLFDPEDAILSVAHYLVLHGWDNNVDHLSSGIFANDPRNNRSARSMPTTGAITKPTAINTI